MVYVADLIGKSYYDVGMCTGLARIVCKRVGVNLPDWGTLTDDAIKDIDNRRHLFTPVYKTDVRVGDLVHIISINGGHHIGVIIDGGRIIHSTKKHGVGIISLSHPWIKNRIAGIYRYG